MDHGPTSESLRFASRGLRSVTGRLRTVGSRIASDMWMLFGLAAVASSCVVPESGGAGDPSELPPSVRRAFEGAETDFQAGRLERALEGYRRVLASAPDHVPTHRRYQDAMIEAGRSDEVRERYRIRFRERGQAVDWLLFGRLEDNPTIRKVRFERALELDPDFGWARYAYGLHLRESGEPLILALEQQERALETLGQRPEVLRERADLLRDLRRFDEAIEAYESFLAVVPGDRYARECIAGCRLRSGDRDGARDAYRALLDERPTDVRSLLGLASIDILDRRPRRALDHLERARSLQPEEPEVVYNMAVVYERLLGDPRRALELYQEYLDRNGDRVFRTRLRVRRLSRKLEESGS